MFDEFSGSDFKNIPVNPRKDSSEYSDEANEELNIPIFPHPSDKTFYKIILEAGEGTEKPGKLDVVDIEIEESSGEKIKKQVILKEEPANFSLLLQSMKRREISELHIEEHTIKVEVVDWISVSDILDNGSMIKTITKRGIGYDFIEYKDDVKLHIKIFQQDLILFNEELTVSCEAPVIPTGLFELLKSMKHLEEASVEITHEYFIEAFTGCGEAQVGKISMEVRIIDLKKVEDMYLDGSFYKLLLVEGEGKNLPNPNAIVRIKYKLEIGEQVVLSNFEETLLEIHMDEDEVPSLWTHCLRQMKEGDVVRVECNLVGLHANYLSDGLDHKYNYNTYAVEGTHSCFFTIILVSFDMGKVNYNMTYQDRCNEANRIKNAGNKLFKIGRFDRAREKYEAANSSLEPLTDSPSILRPIHLLLCGNITLCYLKMEKWHEAEANARKVLQYNPNDVKALYRRALAWIELQNYDAADQDLKNAKRVSEDKGDKEMLVAVERELNKIKAITKKNLAKEKAIYKNLFQ